MMKTAGALLLMAALLGQPLAAANAASKTSSPEVVDTVAVPQSRQVDFTSKINGERYRVQVALPIGPPPAGGYPVIYVLDGDSFFAALTAAARHRSLAGEVQRAVIVGLNYPGPFDLRQIGVQRTRDLTPTASVEEAALLRPIYGVTPESGGAKAFAEIIETEIKPVVEGLAPINRERQILFGHSHGALFALNSLFTQPEHFQTYVAISPSLFWDQRAVLDRERDFERLLAGGRVSARLLIAVGECEQEQPTAPCATAANAASKDRYAMVQNVRELDQRLSKFGNTKNFYVRSKVVPDQTHVSIVWSQLNQILDFAIGRKSAE